jgi:2-oxoglutarate dehydrogenase E2 component (dihydrolipoamide succinyltransferase)
MASEHRIDLYRITGTGQGGRITKKDVLAYLERVGADTGAASPATETVTAAPAAPLAATPTTPAPSPVMPAAERPAAPAASMPGDGEIMPLTTVRRSIAEHMVTSKRTSPHVTTIMEADLSRVTAHRKANKDAFGRDGVNLTFTAYFVAATVAALKEFPLVNSSWTDEGIRLHRAINVGVATSLGDAGLIVPVIKNADGLSLLGVARAVNDLAGRARARQLKPDEVQSGTFTITNHGVSGSLFATPIISQPQCAILGVGMMQKRVVVVSDEAGNDSIAIRPMAYLGLTFDHRILDGALADRFLAKVVMALEAWR